MHEDDLNNPAFDSVFGEGPQVDLGDITDIIKDASIVDLSWLSDPFTFQHSESIVPAHKDLEHNWGDMADSPYNAFKLVKGNPPVREQIKKQNLWDHSQVTADNLYQWAPNSPSRVASRSAATNSFQFFKRLMHRGYTGENLNLEARKYMPQDEWHKAAANRQVLASEEGLLGNVYVDVTSFESCHRAKEVTDKYNKLAKFVLKTSSCSECSYNMSGRCSLVSKKIATRDEIFTDGNTKQYLDYLISVKRVDEGFLNKHASLANSDKLQKAFLARKSVNPRVAGVVAKLPEQQSKANFNDGSYVKVAAKYLSKGYDIDSLRVKFSSRVPHQYLESVFKKAVAQVQELPTAVAPCNSDILKGANLLKRSSKCGGCVYDMSSHCGVSKTAFASGKGNSQRTLTATFAELPVYESLPEELITKTAKALKNGHKFSKVLKAASKITGTNQAQKVLDLALLQVKVASPDQFDACEDAGFALVERVKVGSKCEGCSYNKGVSCGLLRKSFVQTSNFDSTVLEDHHLYGSFYKDLTLDRMVSVNDDSSVEQLSVEGLNEYNL